MSEKLAKHSQEDCTMLHSDVISLGGGGGGGGGGERHTLCISTSYRREVGRKGDTLWQPEDGCEGLEGDIVVKCMVLTLYLKI